ncbi:MAG: chemotaxis protein CheD [Pseudomonadota bacterium]
MDGKRPPSVPPSAHLSQGEVRVTTSRDVCFSTILGSCIATLIWDPQACVGGVNHLLLPSTPLRSGARLGHDLNLMELLINGVLHAGGARENLQAKVFGGAQMIDGLGSTGAANAAFVQAFLDDEGIPCTARSVGGRRARRLLIWPAAGRVQQRRLKTTDLSMMPERYVDLRADALRLSGVELL